MLLAVLQEGIAEFNVFIFKDVMSTVCVVDAPATGLDGFGTPVPPPRDGT